MDLRKPEYFYIILIEISKSFEKENGQFQGKCCEIKTLWYEKISNTPHIIMFFLNHVFFWCCVPLDGGFMKKKKIYEDFAQFVMLMDYWNVVLMKLKLWIIRYRFDWNHYGHTIKLSYYDVTIQLMKKSR